jgi:hypothetical protein
LGGFASFDGVSHSIFKLTYRKCSALSNGLTGFADSDWTMGLSRRSTTGNLFLYNRSPVSWRSKLQKTIALSTAEAEYYSASTAAVEVIYLRYLLRSMGFAPKSWTPVCEDNNACIETNNNRVEQQHYRRLRACQAHRHPEALRP